LNPYLSVFYYKDNEKHRHMQTKQPDNQINTNIKN